MSPQILILGNPQFQSPGIEEGIESAMHNALRTDIHPAAGSHLPVIGNSHLGGNMPIMLIVELSDHHRIGNYNAGSIGTGAEKPQWMSGFNNQCLFLGKFFQILLNQSILHPILANLPGFTISNKFVGI